VPRNLDGRQLCRLLRVRRERPRCGTAEKRDEIAPFQSINPHVSPDSKEGIASYSKWHIAVRGL
jgi:hypothetical protein